MISRPILFSAPMVRALIVGDKTQTRRIAKLPKQPSHRGGWEPTTVGGDGVVDGKGRPAPEQAAIWNRTTGMIIASPYGNPGDRLWVREGITLVARRGDAVFAGRSETREHDLAVYTAEWSQTPLDTWPWKRSFLPAIHMPRGLCRIELDITAVRVERVQDISEEDALAEGVREVHSQDGIEQNAREAYRDLWKHINGAASWDANPWVWVVSFKRAATELAA